MPAPSGSAILDRVRAVEDRLKNLRPVMDKIVDDVILPAMGRNYSASGLKQRTGVLFQGITSRNARGNITRVNASPGSVAAYARVGVDYTWIPYAKFVIEGHGVIRPVNRKVLRWLGPGTNNWIFAMRSPAQPPHKIYFLQPQDFEKAREVAVSMIMKAE